MENIQEQMNSILQNPEMMSQIMSMAQSLSSSQEASAAPQEQTGGFSLPEIDIEAVQKLSGFIGQSNIDQNQRCLLNALAPYLDPARIAKLEKAMRAAKLASLASSLLGNASILNMSR